MRRLILITLLAAALVAGLAACGGSSDGSGGTGTATAPPSPSAAGGGAAIWDAQCSGCHSPDPTGVGVADAKQVQKVVEDGAEGMPAFAGKLSAADIEAVSQFVAKAAQ
jgi:mono/diheme cytochrome c family protein